MTEQIIEWAREAKASQAGDVFLANTRELVKFASLVAAHAKAEERERCATIADGYIGCDVLAADIRKLKD